MGGKLINQRRMGHRGFLMENRSIEQCITIHPSTFSKSKLLEFPVEFVWPIYNDWDGAKILIDAVMARDARTLGLLQQKHPEADFGLGEWWEVLKLEFVKKQLIKRKILRTRKLDELRDLRLELETHSETGARALVAGIYRGSNRVASKLIYQEQLV